MIEFNHKILMVGLVILIVVTLTACSQFEGAVGDEDYVLTDLQAENGSELVATFDNGETVNITNFSPKPLPLGEETKVSFTYEGGSYSGRVTHVINIQGSLNTQKTMSTASVNTSSSIEPSKVVLFFGRDYKIAEVENGKFSVNIDREKPGGIAFIDENDKYIGYLALENGMDSFPTQAISDETGEIDLGEISFDENGVGTPENEPFEYLDSAEKSALAVSGGFFSAVLRSPGLIEKLVSEDRRIDFGLMYFPYVNKLDDEGNAVLDEGTQIAAHRLGIGFDPSYSNFKNVELHYPDNAEGLNKIWVTDEKIKAGEASEDGISFPGVGYPDKAHFEGPPIPPAGEYYLSELDFTFSLPDIQDDAKDNLVFPVPEVELKVNDEGDEIIESITWEYKNNQGETIKAPENVIEYVDIQINAKSDKNEELKGNYDFTDHGPTRIYNSGDLRDGETAHKIEGETLYWDDIGGINMAYNDIYQIHYVTSFGRVDGEDPENDKYELNFIVADQYGDPVPGSVVELKNIDEKETDTEGEVSFEVPEGTIAYNISKEGYIEKSGELEINEDTVKVINLINEEELEVWASSMSDFIGDLQVPIKGYPDWNSAEEFSEELLSYAVDMLLPDIKGKLPDPVGDFIDLGGATAKSFELLHDQEENLAVTFYYTAIDNKRNQEGGVLGIDEDYNVLEQYFKEEGIEKYIDDPIKLLFVAIRRPLYRNQLSKVEENGYHVSRILREIYNHTEPQLGSFDEDYIKEVDETLRIYNETLNYMLEILNEIEY